MSQTDEKQVFSGLDESHDWKWFLKTYTSEIKPMNRSLVGREKEIQMIHASFNRPELSNVLLLASPGSGKTALVQGCAKKDTSRYYREVDLSKMIYGQSDPNEMAVILKALFDSANSAYQEYGKEIVLFIDEFHQIVQLSPVAVEALKPMLADSGTRGIRVIVATTYTEFRDHISANQPLVERLQRISLKEPDKDMTVQILKGMAQRYGVADQFIGDELYEKIYDVTQMYIPANAQPRKSILILDAMIGWHKSYHRAMNRQLLAEVMEEIEGVNVDFRVDVANIRHILKSKVLSQEGAIESVSRQLSVCVAGLNDKSRPMASFLFTGTTGVGKQVADYELVPMADGSFKKHGDLQVGDQVISRKGKPTTIQAVVRNVDIPMYKVTLKDGRQIDVGDEHLWTIYHYNDVHEYNKKKLNELQSHVVSTQYVVDKGLQDKWGHYLYFIPMNEPVQFDKQKPMLQQKAFDVGLRLGSCLKQKENVSDEDLCTLKTLMKASVEKRVSLLQGLMAMIGSVYNTRGLQVSMRLFPQYSELSDLIAQLCYGLGFSVQKKQESSTDIIVLQFNVRYGRVDWLFNPNVCYSQAQVCMDFYSKRKPSIPMIAITDITPIGKQDANCIVVDNEEHLYCVGDYIVTHNTELSKQLAMLLFNDERALLRFDMTEYSQPDSESRFRDNLTTRVWERPFSIVLLDEIEKADTNVVRMLLQVLDDARLNDRHGREVSFKNCYIILTTNAAANVYRSIEHYITDVNGNPDYAKLANHMKLIRSSISNDKSFPHELLGRISCIAPFMPLHDKTKRAIAKMKLEKIERDILRLHGLRLYYDQGMDAIIDFLVYDKTDNDSASGGARELAVTIQDQFTTPIADFIAHYPNSTKARVSIEGIVVANQNRNKEELASQFALSLDSQAQIVITDIDRRL